MIYTNIYIKPSDSASLEQVAQLVSQASGVQLNIVEADDTFFAGEDSRENRRLYVFANEEDDELLAEGYLFDVDVSGRDDESRKAYALDLFEKLKTLHLPMVVVDNAGPTIASFRPAA